MAHNCLTNWLAIRKGPDSFLWLMPYIAKLAGKDAIEDFGFRDDRRFEVWDGDEHLGWLAFRADEMVPVDGWGSACAFVGTITEVMPRGSFWDQTSEGERVELSAEEQTYFRNRMAMHGFSEKRKYAEVRGWYDPHDRCGWVEVGGFKTQLPGYKQNMPEYEECGKRHGSAKFSKRTRTGQPK